MNVQEVKESLVDAIMRSDEEEIYLIIDKLDPADLGIATIVLEVIRDIAVKFLLPASSLQSRNEDGWAFFDLDKLAGYKYPGLISDILKSQFPVLSTPPPDHHLEKELQSAGFQITSPKHRSAFFSGWITNRAIRSLEILTDFLSRMDVAYDPSQLEMLEWLVRSDLSGAIRFRLAKLLRKHSPERSNAVGALVKERYLQDVLRDNL